MTDRKVSVSADVKVSVLQLTQRALYDALVELRAMLDEIDARLGGDGAEDNMSWSGMTRLLEEKVIEVNNLARVVATLGSYATGISNDGIDSSSWTLAYLMSVMGRGVDNYRKQVDQQIVRLHPVALAERGKGGELG